MNGRGARIVASALVLALLGACSSSNKPAGSGNRLTKAQYITRADKICQSANTKTQALSPPTTTDPHVLAQFFTKFSTIIRDAVAQLQQLKPPQSDAAKINKMIGGLQKSISYFPSLIQAVKANDPQRIQQIGQKLKQASLQGQQVAQTYGFHVCANTAPAPTP
jgi:hypothetical protein